MRWFASLSRVVTFLGVVTLSAAAVLPAAAHAPAVAGTTAAVPMTLTVTTADNGSTVQVGAGGDVVLDLRGSPSTGYLWQVIANDDSILLPADPVNAGAVHFFFLAVAAGQSDLAFGLYPAGIPTPVQTFTATATVDWAQHQYLPKVGVP